MQNKTQINRKNSMKIRQVLKEIELILKLGPKLKEKEVINLMAKCYSILNEQL